MSNTNNERTVTLATARRAIENCFATGIVPMVWGPPGVGKSELVAGIADSGKFGNCALVDIRLPLMEPTDVRGIPFYNPEASTMQWAPSEEFPSDEMAAQYDNVILFLDEISAAPPAVQAAAYQLILNRRVGPYVLPKNVLVVAAGNRTVDGSVSYRMPKALQNRMTHVVVDADYEAWLEWAIMNDIHADVIGYISYAKADLMKFDPKSPDTAFATPRSWTFVSRFLNIPGINDADLKELVCGTIGTGLAEEFIAQRRHARDLPNPTDILEGKVTELKTKEISAMFSLTINMCRELQGFNDKLAGTDSKRFHEIADNFFGFMMKSFPTDMVVMGARTALLNYNLDLDPSELKTWDEFDRRFGKTIQRAMDLA